MKLIARKNGIYSGLASRQRDDLALKRKIEQIVKTQTAVREIQVREHRIVSLKASVRGEMEETSTGSKAKQVFAGCLIAGEIDCVREDRLYGRDLFADVRRHWVIHSERDQPSS